MYSTLKNQALESEQKQKTEQRRCAILKLIIRIQFLRWLIFPSIFTTIKQLVNPDYKSSVLPESIVRAGKERKLKPNWWCSRLCKRGGLTIREEYVRDRKYGAWLSRIDPSLIHSLAFATILTRASFPFLWKDSASSRAVRYSDYNLQ